MLRFTLRSSGARIVQSEPSYKHAAPPEQSQGHSSMSLPLKRLGNHRQTIPTPFETG